MSTELSDRTIIEEVSTVARKMRNLFDVRVRGQSLTVSRARALLRIASGHAINQRELAADLAIETATLVRVIDTLEDQGLIERRDVAGDRRAKQVVLTEEGARVAATLNETVDGICREVLSGISSDDMQAVFNIVQTMSANITRGLGGRL